MFSHILHLSISAGSHDFSQVMYQGRSVLSAVSVLHLAQTFFTDSSFNFKCLLHSFSYLFYSCHMTFKIILNIKKRSKSSSISSFWSAFFPWLRVLTLALSAQWQLLCSYHFSLWVYLQWGLFHAHLVLRSKCTSPRTLHVAFFLNHFLTFLAQGLYTARYMWIRTTNHTWHGFGIQMSPGCHLCHSFPTFLWYLWVGGRCIF